MFLAVPVLRLLKVHDWAYDLHDQWSPYLPPKQSGLQWEV